jgi:hypothetical protein
MLSFPFKFFSVPRDGTGIGNIPRRLLTTLPNSGSLHLYLSIRRYSDFRDQDPLDLESRSERYLCVRSYEFSSSKLRAGLVVYNSSRFHRIKLLRRCNACTCAAQTLHRQTQEFESPLLQAPSLTPTKIGGRDKRKQNETEQMKKSCCLKLSRKSTSLYPIFKPVSSPGFQIVADTYTTA